MIVSVAAKILLVLIGLGGFLFVLTRLGVFSGKQPENLGVKDGQLAPCPESPNCVNTQAQDAEHQIAPIPLSTSVEAAKVRMLAVIEALPRTKIVVDKGNYLYVEFRTGVMMFTDDVEFCFDAVTASIHFRSASRLGYSDMGLNRRRMEQIRAAFAAQE
jgi:uncharacterized protein (DUF1499 family)